MSLFLYNLRRVRPRPNFTQTSKPTADSTTMPDMTSLSSFSRLENAIEYYMKVVFIASPAGIESNKSATVRQKVNASSGAAFRVAPPIGERLVLNFRVSKVFIL